MFKRDPLSPIRCAPLCCACNFLQLLSFMPAFWDHAGESAMACRHYMRDYGITGMGLFIEGAQQPLANMRRPAAGACMGDAPACMFSACWMKLESRRGDDLLLMHAGYVVFSISNVTVLFRQSYQRCWGTFQDCNETWTEARLSCPVRHPDMSCSWATATGQKLHFA